MTIDVVILAAGKGTRMHSDLPKVLHPIAGRPMLQHVIDTAKQLPDIRLHVVIGHGAEQVREQVQGDISFVVQEQQLGTGHAVAQALPNLDDDGQVLVLYGDVPLTSVETLQTLLAQVAENSLALLTVNLADPSGYGRIVRHHGQVVAIVEQKDASDDQLAINEVNTGILAGNSADFKRWLPALSNDNAQGEYYLTDVIAMAHGEDKNINTAQPHDEWEVLGVNNRMQQAELERIYQGEQAKAFMQGGLTLLDPQRFDCRGELIYGRDVSVDVNVIIEGQVTLEDGVHIGANTILRNCRIGRDTVVQANSLIDESTVGEGCAIGPFARLRPGTKLANKAKVGNFVETKKALVGEGSKINHLSYVGDAVLGKGVNVGAGTITCNYDGVNKFQTTIGDNAFIGSNASLVAPVTIGEGATTAAGSTITLDVDNQQLAVSRGKQRNINGWKRPTKKS